MTTEQWPTDPEWRRFAARIADAVTVFINNGGQIDDSDDAERGCRCPLGALIPKRQFPSSTEAKVFLKIPVSWAVGFVNGFDGCGLPEYIPAHNPSYQLGRAYRRRFIESPRPASKDGGS